MKKTLLVTGASSDVGKRLVERIATNYSTVLCHYRSSSTVIDELRACFGDRVVALQADFSDIQSTQRFVEQVKEYDVEHFVHMPASQNENRKFSKTNWSEYEEHIDVEVRSACLLCMAVIPMMVKNGNGRVVFMLTENVMRNIPGKFAVPYTVSKFALLGLMKCLSSEYAGKGITVNGVAPSMIETKFVSNLPELTVKLNAEKSPNKRNLTPDDVIGAFEFLLSEDAGSINGLSIAVGVY